MARAKIWRSQHPRSYPLRTTHEMRNLRSRILANGYGALGGYLRAFQRRCGGSALGYVMIFSSCTYYESLCRVSIARVGILQLAWSSTCGYHFTFTASDIGAFKQLAQLESMIWQFLLPEKRHCA